MVWYQYEEFGERFLTRVKTGVDGYPLSVLQVTAPAGHHFEFLNGFAI